MRQRDRAGRSSAREPEPAGQYRRQRGQGLSEYVILLGLIAILVIASMAFAGGTIARTLQDVGAAVSSGVPSGPPPPSAPTPKPTKAPKTPKPTKAPKTPKPTKAPKP